MIEEANTDLMGAIGNLLNRCTGTVLNPKQEYPAIQKELLHSDHSLQLVSAIEDLPGLWTDKSKVILFSFPISLAHFTIDYVISDVI